MSTPNFDFTYFWNWSTRTAFAEYVQLPTTTAPSFWISALISSSVMSLFRIETCFVPAAALAGAALDPPPALAPPPVLAAGALAPPPVEVDGLAPELHALATRSTEATSAPNAPSRLLRCRSSIRRTLLSGQPAPRRATPRTWR